MERIVLRHLKGSKASQIEEFPLEQFSELTIGRDPSSGIRFDPEKDDLVGRQHARISRDASTPYRFILSDLNSRNGTFLNKQRVVGDRMLQPGDVIQLGAGGPELQFDIDPLPSMFVKATRVDSSVGVAETRVGSVPPTSAHPQAAQVSGAISGAASGSSSAAGSPNSIGKATVERMIGETRTQGLRNMYATMGIAAVLILSVFGYTAFKNKKNNQSSAQQQSMLDSLGKAQKRAGELSKQLQPAEIAAANAPAVVQVDFSWKLIHRGSGGQVYHKYVPNEIRMKNGSRRAIVENGQQMVPAYVEVQGTLEPLLTLDQNSGAPIGVSSRGSGFVVTSNGFIITNRHVAYNWQTWYRFNPNDIGPVIDPNTGKPMVDEGGNPVVTRPPTQWIPSETRQAGPKGEIGDFQARVEYLYVRFPKDPTPFEASNVRPSQRHDVALIKVDAPQTLTYVNMADTYDKTRQGDAVTVMGYPGISEEVITVIKSRDMFNREAQQRILPEPTLSTGNVGKILRAADTEVRDGFITLAPSGDTYQLTINSTGGGNSGGPMFDAYGNVIGIYFAGKTGDAQISFAIPIRYAMELLKIGDPTGTR